MEHVQSVISHVWPLWTLLCLSIKWRKYLPYLLFLGFPGRIKWKKVWKCLAKWKLNKWKILIVSPKVQSTWGKNCRNNRPEMPVCAKAKELDPGLRKCLTIQKCRAIACRYLYHAVLHLQFRKKKENLEKGIQMLGSKIYAEKWNWLTGFNQEKKHLGGDPFIQQRVNAYHLLSV